MEKKDEKIVFEDYGIEFSKEDFEGVDIDTLIELKRKVKNTIKEIDSRLAQVNKGGNE